MNDEPVNEDFRTRLARLKAERAAASVPAKSTSDHDHRSSDKIDHAGKTANDHSGDAPDLGDDASPHDEERSELDDILAGVDILEAYDRWCGKNRQEAGGRREGIKVSCPTPGHRDDDPSAWVNLDKQVWFCGGCQEGGDKFDIAEFQFNTGYRADDTKFPELKRQMVLDLGYTIRRTPGGNFLTTAPVIVEDEDDTSSGSVPDVPKSDDTDIPSVGPARVVQLPSAIAADLEHEASPDAEFPVLDWKAVVKPDTFLGEWMKVTSTDDLPEEYYFWEGMAALGLAIGRDAYLEDMPPIYGNLFICLLGPSGIGKSRSIGVSDRLLSMALPYDRDDPHSKGTLKVPSPGSAESLIDSFSKAVEDPTDPKKTAYFAPVRGLVTFNELSLLVGRAQRVGNPLKPILMDLYDGAPVVEVKSRGHGYVRAETPFCTTLTTTQPRSIRDLLSNTDVDSGFVNRWIFATGRPKPLKSVRRNGMDISDAAGALRTVRAWSGIQREITWTEESFTQWDRFFAKHINPMKLADQDPLLTRIDLTLKKCILLLSANNYATEVTTDNLDAALSLYEYLRRSYDFVLGKIGLGQFEDAHTMILEGMQRWKARKTTLVMRDVVQLAKSLKYPSDLIVRVVKTMVEIGEIEEVVTKPVRGPQTVRYRLAE